MIKEHDLEELGWKIAYNLHVLVADFMNYRLYFNKIDNFTIHKESNGALEHEEIFRGRLASRDELEAMMKSKHII